MEREDEDLEHGHLQKEEVFITSPSKIELDKGLAYGEFWLGKSRIIIRILEDGMRRIP